MTRRTQVNHPLPSDHPLSRPFGGKTSWDPIAEGCFAGLARLPDVAHARALTDTTARTPDARLTTEHTEWSSLSFDGNVVHARRAVNREGLGSATANACRAPDLKEHRGDEVSEGHLCT